MTQPHRLEENRGQEIIVATGERIHVGMDPGDVGRGGGVCRAAGTGGRGRLPHP